jgi:hypothetical protein
MKSHPGLAEILGQAIQEAFREVIPCPPPKGKFTHTEHPKKPNSRDLNHRKIIISRSVTATDSTDTLVYLLSAREISPDHIKITQEPDGWLLENWGKTAVNAVDGKNPVTRAEGGWWKFARKDFAFHIGPHKFEIESDLKFGLTNLRLGTQGVQPQGISVSCFRALEHNFFLVSPATFWEKREAARKLVLEKIWAALCAEFRVPLPPLEFPSDAKPGGEKMERFSIEFSFEGLERAFVLLVPVSFYARFEEVRKRPPQTQPSVAPRWVVVGDQEVTMFELLAAEVIALRKSAMLDARSAAGPWMLPAPAPQSAPPTASFPIRFPDAHAAAAHDTSERLAARVPLLVQALVDVRSEPRVSLSENSAVEIAVNGQLLGKGALVNLPSGKLGVRVVTWNG